MSAKPRPVDQVRIGRIRAAIWANPIQGGAVMHNVTVQRLYKVGEEWRYSASFGRHDLPLLAKVLDRAHSWIFEQAAPRLIPA